MFNVQVNPTGFSLGYAAEPRNRMSNSNAMPASNSPLGMMQLMNEQFNQQVMFQRINTMATTQKNRHDSIMSIIRNMKVA